MTTLIPLSLSPQYVSDWGTWEALREFLQNMIDRGSSQVEYHSDGVTIRSDGGTLSRQHLLLGNSSKRDDASTIGSYGEGFKLALLVLLRSGKEVSIQNGADRWTPVFCQHPDLQAQCLGIEIEEGVFSEHLDSVIVSVFNLSHTEVEEAQDRYISKEEVKRIAEGCYDNSYYWRDHGRSKLYVGGLFVCELDKGYKLNYNFAPNVLHLDRDRQQVCTFNLSLEATKLIAFSGNTELLAELADEAADDISDYAYVTESSYSGIDVSLSDEISSRATTTFVKKHGEKAYPINNQWDEKRKRIQVNKAIDSGLVPVVIRAGYYKLLNENVTNKDFSKVVAFDLAAEIKQYFEENKQHIRGKARKRLEQIIENYERSEGRVELKPAVQAQVNYDENSFLDDIPF